MIKSLSEHGNLYDYKQQYLNYEFANNETRNGLWQMCIKDVAYAAFEETNLIVQLSTNLIKDLRIRNNKPETFKPIVGSFLLKAKVGEKKLFQFEPCWFEINSSDTELKIFCTDAESGLTVANNCDLHLTVLLRQVK